MGKRKFSEWFIGNEHREEFNDPEKYRAAKFREWVDSNETYECAEILCSLNCVKPNPKPLQILLRYLQLGLPVPTKDDAYKPSEFPPVWSLTGLIEVCSKPFEKQLTESDVRDDQSRLSINKVYVENFFLPLLNKNDNLIKGIPVIVYDTAGEKYPMTFKIWASKFHVLMQGWKKFYRDHGLQKLEDFVTLWMFYHARMAKLCYGCSTMLEWQNFALSSLLEDCRCSNP